MKGAGKRVMDSGRIAEEVASSGTMAFYLKTLRENPKKIIVGVLDSIFEVVRFVLLPRFQTKLSIADRASLIPRWAKAEMGIPGGTTVLETIWLAYAAARAKNPARSWVEVGCFKGLSTARLSMLCAIWHKQLFACDTFTGLPGSDAIYRAVDHGVDYEFKAGSYAGSEKEVRANVEAYGDLSRVSLVKGEAGETLPNNTFGDISFAFLDVDLVESYRGCLTGLAGNIKSGTVIVIHEACYEPVRNLIENDLFWSGIALQKPNIEYVAEKYKITSCRNIALLMWN